MIQDSLIIGGKSYSSRLLVGTGKYKDFASRIVRQCRGVGPGSMGKHTQDQAAQ